MTKKAISVTLRPENLLWLRGQAHASSRRSVSETLVIWERGLLAWTRRVDLRRPLGQFFADLFSNPAYQPADLTPEQIYQADAARPNRDPFDALICAAARHLELALLTRDDDIRQSGLVRVIW
jgi:PIN domain nuclease of toxin-antitoxin system